MQPSPWPDSTTVVCVASGPSLTREDLDRLREVRILAVSNAVFLCPFVDALYSAEAKWWNWHPELARSGTLPMFTVSIAARKLYPKVRQLLVTGAADLDFEPGCVRTGGHSGYTAINLAVHLGARTIVLLGYDMMASADGQQHFFGAHPDGSHLLYHRHLQVYRTLRPLLQARGIELVNATRRTAIPERFIPRVSVEALFPAVPTAR